jgi:hypothetical protein
MLNDLERLVRDCLIMRLHENEAMAYLKSNGHDVHRATYYRTKGALEATKLKRLHECAARFDDQHLERIERLEYIEQEMIKCSVLEKQPFRRAKILEMVANIQPYLSSYYEATKYVIEGKLAKAEVSIDLPDTGITQEPSK